MKFVELKRKSLLELNDLLKTLLKDLFIYKMKLGGDDFVKTHLLKYVKKRIANIKTLIKTLH